MTVWSLEAEKGCRLEVGMESGKSVACSVDSTVGGISELSVIVRILVKHGLGANLREITARPTLEPEPDSESDAATALPRYTHV